MQYFGIDVSKHNGVIDWKTAAKHIDFAILRLGWVSDHTHTLDTMFRKNYDACRKYGIRIGVYVYMYTATTAGAASGGKWAASQLKDLQLALPVFCDMEDNSIEKLGKTALSNIADTFCKAIENAGWRAGIYANRNWYDQYLTRAIAKQYTTWIAHYTTGKNLYKGQYDMWQNSSKGRVQGISGYVDTDYLYRDLFRDTAAPKPAKRYFKKYTGKTTSIVDALQAIDADSTYAYRAKIAAANGITNYRGTPAQNTRMLSLLKQGKLLRP